MNPMVPLEVIAISDQGDFAAMQQFVAEKTAEAALSNEPKTAHRLRFYAIQPAPAVEPQAGGGLLLKIAMDEAIHRFELAGQSDGIIVVVDALKVCPLDFLEKVQGEFQQKPKTQSLGIETLYEPSGIYPEIGDGQQLVKLAEKIFVSGLKFSGHPYAFPMMELAFAVRASAYQAQAGMSKRKLRPTFDFLQKFVELGTHHHSLTTQVQARSIATNIPEFEIGYAVWKYWQKPEPEYPVFAAESYKALKTGLKGCQSWFTLSEAELQSAAAGFPKGFRQFMATEGWIAKVLEMKRYTTTPEAFEKRFFRWFNSLKTLQYFHYCRDNFWPDQPIEDVGNEMKAWMEGKDGMRLDLKELLAYFGEKELLK